MSCAGMVMKTQNIITNNIVSSHKTRSFSEACPVLSCHIRLPHLCEKLVVVAN